MRFQKEAWLFLKIIEMMFKANDEVNIRIKWSDERCPTGKKVSLSVESGGEESESNCPYFDEAIKEINNSYITSGMFSSWRN